MREGKKREVPAQLCYKVVDRVLLLSFWDMPSCVKTMIAELCKIPVGVDYC